MSTRTEERPAAVGVSPPTQTASLLTLLRRFVKGREKECMMSCLLACILAVTTGVSIMLLIPMLQRCGIGAGSQEPHHASIWIRSMFDGVGLSTSFGTVLIVFVAFSAVQAGLLYYQAVLGGRLNYQFCLDLRVQLYTKMNFAEWETQARTCASDVAHALSVEVDRIRKGVAALLGLCSEGTLVAAFGLTSVFVAPSMSLLALLGCGLFWPLLLYPNKLAKRSGNELTRKTRQFYRDTLDHMAGMKESKVQSAELRHVSHFDQLANQVRLAGLDFERARGATSFVFSLGAALSLCLMLYVGTEIVRTPAVDLIVMVVVFARLIPKLRQVQGHYQQVIHALPALDTISRLDQRYERVAEPVQGAMVPLCIKEGLMLRDVCYCYGSQAMPTLKGISLQIPAQKVTAIVGESGAGKSTLADVLLGLLIPDSGEVLIDGQVLCHGNLAAWRNAAGYVPQKSFLLNDTVRANLLWSKPNASDSEIKTALELAAIGDVIQDLPAGLDTIIGERGVHLSGGERQRVTLARAFLRQPSVLILDEATSSLDAVNQQKILSSLRAMRGTLTVILFAHRLSTIREADQIVLLRNGQVAGQGKFSELCATSDHFRELITEEPLLSSSRAA